MRRIGIAAATLLAALLAAAGPARAQEPPPPPLDTTADLLSYCDGSAIDDAEVERDRTFCEGFIAGTGLFYIELVNAKRIKPLACAEPVPTLQQARDAFVAWGRANPQRLREKPIDGFWRAMQATYPCAP